MTKCNEFNVPLCIGYSDSVQHEAILKAVRTTGENESCATALPDIYTRYIPVLLQECTRTPKSHREIPVLRGAGWGGGGGGGGGRKGGLPFSQNDSQEHLRKSLQLPS